MGLETGRKFGVFTSFTAEERTLKENVIVARKVEGAENYRPLLLPEACLSKNSICHAHLQPYVTDHDGLLAHMRRCVTVWTHIL